MPSLWLSRVMKASYAGYAGCHLLPPALLYTRIHAMKRMSLKRFGEIVAKVMETLPAAILEHLKNIVVDVEDEPSIEMLDELGYTDEEIDAGESLYGLFVPFNLGAPDNIDFLDRPNRVLIFKRPLEEDFPDERQLMIEIRKTVIHELAHHFGWTDRDLERFDDNPNPFGDEVTP